MSYQINLNKENFEKIWSVIDELRRVVNKSRFTVEICRVKKKIYLGNIRLKESKGYCGNHAGPCRFTGGKHRKLKYLEGADWVAFNDMINNMLDKLQIKCNAGSSTCNIRKGFARRINYTSTDRDGEWCKKGEASDYEVFVGKKAPRSTYPEGTPGYDTI